MSRKIILTAGLCIFFHVSLLFSQGKINIPAIACQSDLVNFSYTPPAGATLSSASWNFGDGFTSGNNTPAHAYGNPGKFTVIIQALLTNSATIVDSVKINIVGLPRAGFSYDLKSDTCLYRSKICFIDTSRPAIPGQTIVSRIFAWGDGQFTSANRPGYGQKTCHHYQVSDKYSVKMEITDTFGCKNYVSSDVFIAENVVPAFTEWSWHLVDCFTASHCFRNTSTFTDSSKTHFEWYFDNVLKDTFQHFDNEVCANYKGNTTIMIKLIGYANSGCRDTLIVPFGAKLDTIPSKLELLDTAVCFFHDGLNQASFGNIKYDDVFWYFDQSLDELKKSSLIYFGTKIPLGMHQVKAAVVRGSCTADVVAFYEVKGPIASFKVVDGQQCFSNRDVFFYTESPFINQKNCIFRWNIVDTLGENCTCNRIKDINKNRNCNKSVDWFTKYKFSSSVRKRYEVSLWVMDTVIGCYDSVTLSINMKNCSIFLEKDSFEICRGTMFASIPQPFPEKFLIDSARQKWMDFPHVVDSSFKKVNDLGIITKTIVNPWAEHFGDDSMKLHYNDSVEYYDTFYRRDYLIVREPKDEKVTLVRYGNCKPFRLSIKFRNGMFYDGDTLNVEWFIDTVYDIRMPSRSFRKRFTKTERIDSFFYVLDTSAYDYYIKVFLSNRAECSMRATFADSIGRTFTWPGYDYLCQNAKNCFPADVLMYYNRSKGPMKANKSYQHLSWWFDDTGTINEFSPCYRFKTGGIHHLKVMLRDTFGCRDTISDSVFVQDMKADLRYTGKTAYCSQFKQFYDSSYFRPHPYDSIKTYFWKFGDGVFSTLQKDPLQNLNLTLDKIPAAHYLLSWWGCRDTIRFDIDVKGPKPAFSIPDTIGCGSLNAVFHNLSRECSKYIWQYGDSAQSTYQTFSSADVSFFYKKPGRYFITLVGVDTIFNPFTNSFQPCVTVFPDPVYQKDTVRSVLVMPLLTTGIGGRDTICLGTTVNFKSHSDTSYDFDIWDMGDGNKSFLDAGAGISYKYQKTGLFNITLKPGFSIPFNNRCRDSAETTILVLGIDADFDIDPSSKAPVFLFHDKSNPANALLKWDFGHTASGALNNSTEYNPTHDYLKDSGTYRICLVAAQPFGCADTVCKTIFNPVIGEFGIYNVFTPALVDGMNDRYDIQVENEDLYELKIYDRWGIRVFNGTEDAETSNWNGKVNNTGAECPAGTYYYIFRYSLKDKPAEIITISGVITLIR
jgi:gliding motility-associated-like protein